jgi:manganese transport protein
MRILEFKRTYLLQKIYRGVVGPATIIAVAYIDPGNFASNIEAGSKFGLELLWVVWVSGVLAILYQYLSGKLGILLGVSPFDIVLHKISLGRRSIFNKWMFFTTIFIILLTTDLAELIGILLGLAIILKIPVEYATPFAIADVLILLFFVDKLEYFELSIGILISIVGFSIIYELILAKINLIEVVRESFSINFEKLYGEPIVIATAIIGATIMPHALLLHSYIARDKWHNKKDLKSSLREHKRDTIINLSIASIMNAAIQIMSYYMFYRSGVSNVSIENIHKILQPLYGEFSLIVFGIALLFSGIASSIVSVQTGVYVFESFIGKRLSKAFTRFVFRSINMIPLILIIFLRLNVINILVYTQTILSIMLPAVIIPLIYAVLNKKLMGSHVNIFIKMISVISSVFIIGVNLMLLTHS